MFLKTIQVLPKNRLWVLFAGWCLYMPACQPPRLYTTWTSPSVSLDRDKQSSLLVLCLLDETETFTRMSVESVTADLLRAAGTEAVAAWEYFGLDSTQLSVNEQSLQALNDRGFDRVIVITCIDKYKAAAYSTANTGSYPATWYYRRMANCPYIRAIRENAGTAYWEIILADLHQLEAVIVARTKPHYLPYTFELSPHLPQWIVNILHRE